MLEALKIGPVTYIVSEHTFEKRYNHKLRPDPNIELSNQLLL